MRAVQIRNPGPDSRLEIVEVATPAPRADELRVRVVATAANRADLVQRAGHYPPPPGESEILGLEMAGVVESAGRDCTRFRPGDRVFGLLAGGGYAEYVVVPEVLAMPVPDTLDLIDAAAVPEVFMTAWQALHWHGALAAGETALIHAGASGVGTAAIQLARRAGARALVTASAPKHALCRELGADAAIDYRSESFPERVAALTGGAGADVIIDFMAAAYLEDNVRAAALDGRIVLLALMGGARAEGLNLGLFFRKRLTLKASTLRNRSRDYKARLARDFEAQILPALVSGELRPVIDRRFDWTDVEEAHALMAANRTQGKLVLQVGRE
jgi:putative PIG3 family NAD(P)H quinone oxidoreductase